MNHQTSYGGPPPVPQRPSANQIEICNVREGETVHQVNWLETLLYAYH